MEETVVVSGIKHDDPPTLATILYTIRPVLTFRIRHLQSRVRELLVNLLMSCGQRVGLPKSPSVRIYYYDIILLCLRPDEESNNVKDKKVLTS